MAGHWLGLLEAIVAQPDTPIAELPLLSPGERETQLHGWNATATAYPLDTPVHQLIEAQVQRTPMPRHWPSALTRSATPHSIAAPTAWPMR